MIDDKDVDQALAAATAIGDDRLQTPGAGPGRARQLHPRHQRAARALVPHRAGQRRSAEVRYVPGAAALARSDALAGGSASSALGSATLSTAQKHDARWSGASRALDEVQVTVPQPSTKPASVSPLTTAATPSGVPV